MANKAKFYTAIVNFTTKKVYLAESWDNEEEAKHQDNLNSITAEACRLGQCALDNFHPEPAGDDWQAYGPEPEPFYFAKVIEISESP
jgi:hypothetical protein